MNRIHLPESIYEGLPWLYLALATVLAVVAPSAFNWSLIAGLVVAVIAVRRQRRAYRETLQWQQAAAFIDRLERSRKRLEDPQKPSTVEI